MKCVIFDFLAGLLLLIVLFRLNVVVTALVVRNEYDQVKQSNNSGSIRQSVIQSSDLCLLSLWPLYSNQTLVRRDYRILISITFPYLTMLLNWLLYFHNLCQNIQNLYFICLDSQSQSQLGKIGLQCHHTHQVPRSGTQHRIWLIRGNIVHQLLTSGYDVILSDLDAIWLQNPFVTLNQFPGTDIIASRASFPETVFDRIGATLCMGFAYFKSNHHVISLWEEATITMTKSKHSDDQRTINMLIMNSGLKYNRGVRLNYARNFVNDHGSFTFRKMDFNLTLLSHSQFQRLCRPDSQPPVSGTTVVHCFAAEKGVMSKVVELKRRGLWKLRDDWMSFDPAGLVPLANYLSSISNTTAV